MHPPLVRALLPLAALFLASVSCGPTERPLLPRSQTWAELRAIRRGVTVTAPGEGVRAPHPRERLIDGETVHVAPEGLAWLRRDGGATLLVRGPAELTVRAHAVELAEGRVFIDTPSGRATELTTPAGPLHLAHVRASIDVGHGSAGGTEVYVLAGEVRTDVGASGARWASARAGERLVMKGSGKDATATTAPVLAWDDWTGGLATTDRAAEPSPYGVGTVGARRPGDTGAPRFPLAIQKLDVRVSIEQDFALTEVDEVFFNPSSETVEGIYRFRTPDGATLHLFGVDRDGVVKWGRVKEKQAAAAQYQANVYQGSTEDPALLEWDGPGVYRARLYPIGPGETRRVVVRYAEWLARTGEKHERRLYVYPMAADGAEESLPHIEELYATVDLARAGAKDVRTGMAGVRDGDTLVVREHDLVPRADLAVELFDDGPTVWRGYRAPHVVDVETLPPSERPQAMARARNEEEYVLVPVWDMGRTDAPRTDGADGLDLAIVVDTSAATDTSALAVARAATGALLSHLGKGDRAVVWAGDAGLRPVVPGKDKLGPMDDAARRDVLGHLAAIERGGATDLGAMLADAAASLDPAPARRGAVVYIGDGAPTVGELALGDLEGRLSKLPRPVRIFGLGVGDAADMAILKGLSLGAFAERIGDANAAARAALRLLEVAERPARLGASVDLGPTVERIFPRDLGAVIEGDGQVVVGRLTGAAPTSMTVKSAAGEVKVDLRVAAIDEQGDLRRRWAEGQLAQMMNEGAGDAAKVDLGLRNGIITPVTSLYVPTKNEMTAEERAELSARRTRRTPRFAGKKHEAERGRDHGGFAKNDEDGDGLADGWDNRADNKEGGTGTRAKGEEGSMGNPNTRRAHALSGYEPEIQADQAFELPKAQTGMPADRPVTVTVTAAPTSSPVAGLMLGRGTPAEAAAAVSASASPAAAPPTPDPAPSQGGAAGVVGGRLGGPMPVSGLGPAKGAPGPAPVGSVVVKLPTGNTVPGTGVEDANRYRTGLAGDEKTKSNGDDLDKRAQKQGIAGETRPESSWYVDGLPAEKDAEGQGDLVMAATNGARRADLLRFEGTEITVRIGEVGHRARRCGEAAFLPLEERAALWRERLGPVAGNAPAMANVYHRALAACEAPSWRERSRLTGMMLDFIPDIGSRVSLWRFMFHDIGAADALYRGMLARVRTPEEIRALHDALGLRSIDPGVLARILKEAKTPAERVTKLRGLWAVWRDDFTLALKLLDALEDADDDAGARDLARVLRARPDADARVRTAVGELYLRLAARAKDPAQKALDEGEARRAFGEIVEFAPEDPIARRRIGDLLRAHGWYADAARQYETLARLTPDDTGVYLLLAAAAEGMGKLEEAVKWTEKGGASGAPDAAESPARTARAFAATYLAWGRAEALAAGRADEAKTLSTRLARVRSAERAGSEGLRGTRVTLVWAHPELHPRLWTNALGAPMPAPEVDLSAGIAAATVPARGGAFVEVRLDEGDDVEHAARLGAEAILTVVFDEGAQGEKIVRKRFTFARGGSPVKRFSLGGGDVTEVAR